jgi:hypothetical protein
MTNHKIQAPLRIAALGGYLEGLSLLSKDSRSNFATAYKVEASNVTDLLSELASQFKHLPDLEFDIDERFQVDIFQLEQIVMSHLLVDPYIEDKKTAEDMRKYLAFKILDRIGLEVAELKSFEQPKRIVGRSMTLSGLMVFYLLVSPKAKLVLQFAENSDWRTNC